MTSTELPQEQYQCSHPVKHFSMINIYFQHLTQYYSCSMNWSLVLSFVLTLCPSCQWEPENHRHLLECQHQDCAKLFNELKRNLTNATQHFRLHPCLHTAIWLGLTSIRHRTQYPAVINEVLEPIRSPILWQSQLGWDQLYQGRMAIHWAQSINTIHPEMPMNGTQVMAKIQTTIWTYILDLWKLCNAHLHQNTDQLDLPNYRQAHHYPLRTVPPPTPMGTTSPILPTTWNHARTTYPTTNANMDDKRLWIFPLPTKSSTKTGHTSHSRHLALLPILHLAR